MKKICNKCNTEKNLSEFSKDKSSSDGYHGSCKLCKREGDRERYQKTQSYREQTKARSRRYREANARLVSSLKTSMGCCICGENEHPSILDLHHLESEDKEFTISENRSRHPEQIINEIYKCVVVCRNCHGKIHVGIRTVLHDVAYVEQIKGIIDSINTLIGDHHDT